jgi:hypothetical protein
VYRRTIIMSGRLRRVQSFVSLEFEPASDGAGVWPQAIAARAALAGELARVRSADDLGIAKEKVLPAPGRLVAQILPPCASMIAREM